jgi:delta8-fatty-acid desaturase
MLEDGWFKTDYTFYYCIAARLTLMFGIMLHLVLNCTNWWAHFAGACMLGGFWQQLAFIGHDLGHNGITHIKSVDNLLGICIGNLIGGISIGWWKRSHNVHHIVCNSIDHDPDI